jgi:hypothetical protein
VSRELDVQVARALGLNVVSDDWPCGYRNDGELVAQSEVRFEDGRFEVADGWLANEYDMREPVYATGPWAGWPDKKTFWSDIAVTPVPHYSTWWGEAGRLWEWLEARGTGLQLQQGRPGRYCATIYAGGIFALQGDTPLEALARLVVSVGKAGLKPEVSECSEPLEALPWVSMKEQQPKGGQVVVAWVPGAGFFLLGCREVDGQPILSDSSREIELDEISHWMAIEKPEASQ